MAQVIEMPCNGDGTCMVCKVRPLPEETLTCHTCVTPWHVTCLLTSSRPETVSGALDWACPDCCVLNPVPAPSIASGEEGQGEESLVAKIKAIEADDSLTEADKAKRRQSLLGGPHKGDYQKKINMGADVYGSSLICTICMFMFDMPVTIPACGHNFCLKCFNKWVGQGKRTCANCREAIPSDVVKQPRVNHQCVSAVRWVKMRNLGRQVGEAPTIQVVIRNEDKPDEAYLSERAKKKGRANACSGRIFVTIPSDHFGPILKENDPVKNLGVQVGDTWKYRSDCRQWGVHFPPVAGIAGQFKFGAQSVVLAGGYKDDEDHGDWFLYTGSGGRDLSGNKRTNSKHSFDQEFTKLNQALRVSCQNGYPVRVVRSDKERRTIYAPASGLRYDGIYRIEKCWRKNGIQGYKVCRYLFVRCDNAPAPWTSDNDEGDRPRPLPRVEELTDAVDIIEREESPSWDFDEQQGWWRWVKAPPPSQMRSVNPTRKASRKGRQVAAKQRLLKEFGCRICRKVMKNPMTTPCGHNFCQGCLESKFAGQTIMRERRCGNGRSLRATRNVINCPSCLNDIADFLHNAQVNRELMGVIQSLQREMAQVDCESQEDDDGDGAQIQTDISPTDPKRAKKPSFHYNCYKDDQEQK